MSARGKTECAVVEKLILRKVLEELKKVGFIPVRVWDGGEYVRARAERTVLKVVYTVGCATIHFAPVDKPKEWGATGVFVVTGNGIDVISDWHTQDRKFDAALERVAKYVNHLEEEHA